MVIPSEPSSEAAALIRMVCTGSFCILDHIVDIV